ncbi:MAG TPA: PLP-dependent aminotransferase family protein [Candidatus Eremiobacteraceae bacterium]|nr:PLP-dependent aminotransferase family protein [Candidatus Eremiobacteraceae bacterium]
MVSNGVNDDARKAALEPVAFSGRDRRPLYQQLAEGVAAQIRDGALPKGTKLPPQREIAKTHGIALVTASQAYEVLAAEGLVESRTGRGTFVSYDPSFTETRLPPPAPGIDGSPLPALSVGRWDAGIHRYATETRRVAAMQLLRSAVRPGAIAISAGHTAPETYPVADFAQCYARTFLDDPPEIHQYRADRGDESLRAFFADRLRARGADVGPDDILIVSGAQQALSLVAETLLEYGSVAAAEAPTYFSALEVFDQRRVSWVNLAADDDGLVPASFADVCRRNGPRVAYINTAAQNPTGSYLARARHRKILDVARQAQLTIVEDQTCWPLAYDAEAPPPLFSSDSDGRVVLIESMSKLLMPSLRIGYIAAKGAALQALYAAKLRADSFTTTVAQRALLRFLESKAPARHLRATRFLYKRRRDALHAALLRVLPEGSRAVLPRGGLNIWVELPAQWSSMELFGYAAQEGVVFLPGQPFYPTDPAINTLRLSFGKLPEQHAGEAMERLGRAIRAYSSSRKRRRDEHIDSTAAAAV